MDHDLSTLISCPRLTNGYDLAGMCTSHVYRYELKLGCLEITGNMTIDTSHRAALASKLVALRSERHETTGRSLKNEYGLPQLGRQDSPCGSSLVHLETHYVPNQFDSVSGHSGSIVSMRTLGVRKTHDQEHVSWTSDGYFRVGRLVHIVSNHGHSRWIRGNGCIFLSS